MTTDEKYHPRIPRMDESGLSEFAEKKAEIISEVVRRSLEFKSEVAQHGPTAKNVLGTGFAFTLDAIQAAMEFGEPKLLQHQIEWAVDRLPHDNVQPDHLSHRFKIFKEVIAESFSADRAKIIHAYFDVLIEELRNRKANIEQLP